MFSWFLIFISDIFLDLLVLYDEPNFGGSPVVIKTEVKDLDSVKFNNRASSFKIYGGIYLITRKKPIEKKSIQCTLMFACIKYNVIDMYNQYIYILIN